MILEPLPLTSNRPVTALQLRMENLARDKRLPSIRPRWLTPAPKRPCIESTLGERVNRALHAAPDRPPGPDGAANGTPVNFISMAMKKDPPHGVGLTSSGLLTPNPVLGCQPPKVSSDKQSLGCRARITLAQLRAGYSTVLNSYKARIFDGVDDLCPNCGEAVHTTAHCSPAWRSPRR